MLGRAIALVAVKRLVRRLLLTLWSIQMNSNGYLGKSS